MLNTRKRSGVCADTVGVIGKETLVLWVGPGIARQGRLGQHTILYLTDILVDGAVPDYAEYVAQPIVSQIIEKSYPAAQTQVVVLEQRGEVLGAIMLQ